MFTALATPFLNRNTAIAIGIGTEALREFLNEFSKVLSLEYGVTPDRILVYGSASRGRWKVGSDLDMAVFTEKTVSLRTKQEIYGVYWSLSDKYGLALDCAPAPHPPIVFVDNPFKRLFAWLILVSSFDFREGRRLIKRIFPRAADLKRVLPYVS
jgi:predicted nucleotidyltransferase